jgi:tetratricopeptide (TPR) repeat protein
VMNAYIFRAISLELLGWPARAAEDAKAAIEAARRSGDAYLIGNIHWVSTMFHVLRGDIAAANAVLQELTPLAIENGFGSWFLQSRASMAYVHCRRGELSEGLGLARAGVAMLEQRGLQGVAIYTLLTMWMAACLEMAGDADRALDLVSKALEVGTRTKERWLFAELYRLRGDWMVAHRRGSIGEAEAAYLEALDIARSQRAALFELRAATGLARLWCGEGRHAEAHDVLAPVLGRFDTAQNTIDLDAARALLGEAALSSGR